jgi:antitoxin (DNA-binding transcriptional repressor) of toxin-antitoxin stability system
MATLHISEAEAASDFPGLMARVREGAEVIIESGEKPVAILRPAELPHRTISESIAIIDSISRERGYEAVMDPDFAADVEERIRNRKPRDRSAYEE